MSYPFPPDLQQQVKKRMASGLYSSEDDVLRDALEALERQDAEVAAIQQGIDDLEAGRATPLRDFDRAFRQKNHIPSDG